MSRIRLYQNQLIEGQTQFAGFDVRIHTGDPTGKMHPDNRRHQAWITGPNFNTVIETSPSIQAKTLREFCWDVAVWLCEHIPVDDII